jgi:putative addiction module killer protein
MYIIRQTETFANWLSRLKDRRAAVRIASRLLRAEDGNLGDTKAIGDGISEIRVDYGPGYRVYFIRDGFSILVLLCGGDKSSQQRDIRTATALAKEWKEKP